MAECIYRRQGQSFKSFLCITANPGDRVTIVASDSRGLDGITNPFVMGDAGKVVLTVKKKGTYKVSGEESNITQTATVIERRHDYNVDVSFKNTVTVKANPYATITLSNYDGVTRRYSAAANSSGVATVTVKRKGTYYISTSTTSSNTSLSIDPAVTDKVVCDTNKGTKSAIYVRVTNISAIWSELTSATGGNTKCSISVHDWGLFTGAHCQYKIDSAPSNRSDGKNLFSSGTSGTTGNLTLNRTWYFKVWPYVTINGVKYYGIPWENSRYVKSTAVYNIVRNDSGSYTVPEACHTLNFVLVGGGGGGAGNGKSSWRAGGGGGGGRLVRGTWSVNPGDVIYYTSGGGGTGGTTTNPGNGGESKISVGSRSATAAGGDGAGYTSGYRYGGATQSMGGHGGSGGGRGSSNSSSGDPYTSGNYGGSDGCAGGKTNTSNSPAVGSEVYVGYSKNTHWSSGNGQGKWDNGTWYGTTHNGVIYCGGGGGGDDGSGNGVHYGGSGGGGNGGNDDYYTTYWDANSQSYKKTYWTWGGSGTNGSGGGGGGSGKNDGVNYGGGNGGSGCVIITLT